MIIGYSSTSKRTGIRRIVASVLVSATIACSRDSKTIVVLVDTSKTVASSDSSLYQVSFETVLRSIRSGDRLVVATISGQTIVNFKVDADVVFPKTGVDLNDEEARASAITVASNAFSVLLKKPKEDESNLLDALAIASEVFARDKSRPVHWIVALSDMRQESREYNFRTHPIDSAFTANFFVQSQKSRTLPNLKGTRIWVSGAAGDTRLRDFWLQYFSVTGAICDLSMFGRTAIVSL